MADMVARSEVGDEASSGVDDSLERSQWNRREYPWAVYFEGPPSFIWGEGEREGQTNLRNTSQLTKQYYFTAKIPNVQILFRRISVDPLTSDWRRIAVAKVVVEYLKNGVYCLPQFSKLSFLSLLSSLLWRPTQLYLRWRGRGRGRVMTNTFPTNTKKIHDIWGRSTIT